MIEAFSLSHSTIPQIPVTAIDGARSQGENVGKAIQKKSKIKVRSVVMADTGHYIPEEQAIACAETLFAFVSEIDRESNGLYGQKGKF